MNHVSKIPINIIWFQIRRMIGTLNAVAIGKLPAKEIKVMLQVPSKHSWHNFIQSGPPDGLYLCDVHYRPEDLIYDPEKNQEKEECLSDSECDWKDIDRDK